MINLKNQEGIKEYLQEKKIFLDGNVEFIDIGNINYVYKIKTGKSIYYLKYYGTEPRKTTEAIEKIGFKQDRFEKEIGAIQFLRDTLDSNLLQSIPKIFYSNMKEKVLILTDVAQKGVILKDLLLTKFNVNQVDEVLKKVAQFIAQQHARTFQKENFEPYFKDDEEFNKRFYGFRTYISCEKLSKKQQKEVMEKANLLFEKNKLFSCLINADLSPKQIFIRPDSSVGLCDFEIMGKGLAVYDIGFFLSNIYIIKVIRDDYQEELTQVMKNFLKYYFLYLKKEIKEKRFINFIKENLSFFIGTGVLNRIDAVPLEVHIPESKVEELRKIAIDFIFENKTV